MHVEMRRIGNSRGIIFPKAIIEQCHLEREIDLQVVNGVVTIQPVGNKRANWAKAFEAAKHEDHTLEQEWQSFSNSSDGAEWLG